jgi:hypothetical protein
VTTAAKRARKKANRAAKLEKLAQLADEAMAHADDDIEPEKTERPESEKAAAMTALAAAKAMRKKLRRE